MGLPLQMILAQQAKRPRGNMFPLAAFLGKDDILLFEKFFGN